MRISDWSSDVCSSDLEKLAQRLRWFPNRPALASFLVMFGILNVAYFMYCGAFTLIRISGLNTSVACPYPYPEAKVYDPNGYYERERSEEHTSELQSLMRSSYSVFC